MCCRKILVVFTLIIVLEAAPWRPKKRKITSEVVSTKKYAITYDKSKLGRNKKPEINTLSEVISIPESITPIDDPTAKNKQILHKCRKIYDDADYTEFKVQPLEIDGVVISGINNWFSLDDHNEFTDDFDEAYYYDYYEAYTEEFWKETVFEYDLDE